MGKFLTSLDGRFMKKDKETFVKLNRPLRYQDSKGIKYKVPEDFMSDGASIPKFAWSIVGHPFGEYLDSAILHDWLYKEKGKEIKRGKSDWILLDAMKTQKVAFWKRHIMHKMVRIFGGIHKMLTSKKGETI